MILKGAFVLLFMTLMVHANVIPSSFKRDNSSDSFLKIDFQKVDKASSQDSKTISDIYNNLINFSKRSGSDSVTLNNNDSVFYYVELLLGSDKQKVGVAVDTGSADLWVPATNAKCQSERGACDSFGSFDTSSSTSYKDLNENFEIGYADGTQIQGEYGTDTVAFAQGGKGVSSFQFATASQDSSNIGILGISFKGQESTNQKYDNLPVALAKQGVISKAAYSLYLNEANSSTGSIIFGGVDNAKYSGNLVKLDAVNEPYTAVKSSGFSTPEGFVSNSNGSLILDSGTTLAVLPHSVLEQISSSFSGTFYNPSLFGQSAGGYTADCDQGNTEIITEFPGYNLTISANDLIQQDDGTCYIGIEEGDLFLIGDIFLRHLYAVYDLDDQTISLADAKYTSDSDISAL